MRRLIGIIGLLLLVSLLVPVSCAKASQESKEVAIGMVDSGSAPAVQAPMPPVQITREATMDYQESGAGDFASMTGEPMAEERMIVRIGNMSLVVEDVAVTIDQIVSMSDGFGGYVVSSRVWKEGERLVGSITVRVPAEHFDDAVRALRGLAVDVTSESTSSKDVTEEYVDLSAKLHNLEATEAQLLRIMEKAATVEEILNVQRELSNTRGQIEQTKARMQYLERTSTTSLIEVRLEQSKLSVEFYADKTRVKEQEAVWFYARISGGFSPYSYEWDFGDGNTDTGEALNHTYKSDGSYTVSLTVTDDKGNTDTEIRDEYIVVLPGWSAGSIASSAWNGLITFGRVLADIFIWIGFFSPVWIVVGGIVYWWWRRHRRKETR